MKFRKSSFLMAIVLTALAGTGAWAEAKLTRAPINPAFLKYMEKTNAKSSEGLQVPKAQRTGRIPSPVNLSHLSGLRLYDTARTAGPSFPEKYDLRDYGFVSPVRDQNPYGTCWTFAAMASLESSAIKAGIQNPDYSEMLLAYYGYIDQSRSLVGFGSYLPEDFPDTVMNLGGNDFKAAALLARGTGAVNESDAPYDVSLIPSPTAPVSRALRHVYNIYVDPETRNPRAQMENMKYAIMEHGALSIGVYASDPMGGNWDDSPYFNKDTASAYIPKDNPDQLSADSANHAVTVVGWDDSYSKKNFNSLNQPPLDGAWIVKNSWSSDWGKGGYFYLSYYDSSIDGATAFEGGDPAEYDTVYQYDPLGWVSNGGFGSEEAWFGNVFTAKHDTEIKAAGLYASGTDNRYRIQVYRNVGSDPSSGVLVHISDGTIQEPGYHTIPFGKVTVAKGEKFAVVVRMVSPGQNNPIAIEPKIYGYSDKASSNYGESYISKDGTAWYDITTFPGEESTNVCLKVFGTAGGRPEPPAPIQSNGGCLTGFGPGAALLLLPLFVLIKKS